MSKLSFRARALDASKPMPIYMAEELPDLPDYSVINRAVPQMPSGMEKEEECEHHLQRAICAGLIIPTPEVSDLPDKNVHDKLYPASYKQPRQLIHMQPFTMEQDIPDYDMDSEDERWLDSQAKRLDISPLKFEEMMDRLEKSSGQTVVSIQDAKALLKEDDDLIIAVFDYWLNKRLTLQHPLLLAVKTEHRAGTAVNNPYIAFRRRTEKMQTRKNRKNDETSYEKMLKLRRDLSRAVSLLEFIKKREKMKRELVHLTVEVFEKRYHAKDFSGAIAAEFMAQKAPRPAFTPIFQNNYTNHTWNNKAIIKEENIQRNQKRPYKKRKHKAQSHNRVGGGGGGGAGGLVDSVAGGASSDEEAAPAPSPEVEEPEDEGLFAFRRNKNCSYHMPLPGQGNWPWCGSQEEHGATADKKYRYTLTSLSNPRRCIGFARRRIGRGGRVIIDRLSKDINDFWRTMDYTVYDSTTTATTTTDSNVLVVDNSMRTDIKSEPQLAVRTSSSSVSDVVSANDDVVAVAVKQEELAAETNSIDVVSNGGGGDADSGSSQPVQTEKHTKMQQLPTKEEHDEMLEILQSVRREWLHFRPKTPPPDYSPPCNLLPADDIFTPSANTPFSLELKAIDDSDIFTTEASFMSTPFLLDYDISMEVPVTDTRQSVTNHHHHQPHHQHHHQHHQHNDTPNTLTSTNLEDASDDEIIGCSRFSVSDGANRASKRQDRLPCNVSSTFTSPKLNSVNVLSSSSSSSAAAAPGAGGASSSSGDVKASPLTTATAALATTHATLAFTDTAFDSSAMSNANGILTHVAIEGNRTRNNKLQPFNHPYSRPMGNNSTFRSLHTSAHTVSLNSHNNSANILEIPMSNDTVADAVVTATKGQRDTGATSPNSKTKTIVRKNLVMEVT